VTSAEDMVLIPRAELEALRAENRRLRRESGNREALKRIRSDSGEGRTFTREELADAWGISE
jgi:PHD/YefM family antitoxin component YafN of YafNO toxin-antitoxin module